MEKDNTNFDTLSKEEIKKLPEEKLIDALKYYKEDLEYMKQQVESKLISPLQASEFNNSDKIYAQDRIKVIEEELDKRSLK